MNEAGFVLAHFHFKRQTAIALCHSQSAYGCCMLHAPSMGQPASHLHATKTNNALSPQHQH